MDEGTFMNISVVILTTCKCFHMNVWFTTQNRLTEDATILIRSLIHLRCVCYEGMKSGKWNLIPFLHHFYIWISFTRVRMESKIIMAETNFYF